ncbi:hypothetical protein FOA52_000279 [Chlamydomonas sp. UWO 241]|nr:hypothetical protein FOA52_000279 [Chlamydomonas sp. UWO 241]
MQRASLPGILTANTNGILSTVTSSSGAIITAINNVPMTIKAVLTCADPSIGEVDPEECTTTPTDAPCFDVTLSASTCSSPCNLDLVDKSSMAILKSHLVARPADTTPPTITCPADATALPNDLGVCAATTSTGTATASDNCGTTSIAPAPGATLTLPVGINTVGYTASDGATPANTATCTQTVTVVDTEAPLVNCPATYVVMSGSNCTARMPDLAAEATYSDNCGLARVSVTVSGKTYAPGACLPTAVCDSTLSATITVTDGSGNAAACTTTLLIDGPSPPQLPNPP